MSVDVIGKGSYTTAEAAMLTGLTTDKIRRWVDGYSRRTESGADRPTRPLFEREYARFEGQIILSFLDLIELKFVTAFLNKGLPLSAIRRAAAEASKHIQSSHPFCTLKFGTDGKRFFVKDDHGVADLSTRQQNIEHVIKSYVKYMEFSHDELLRFWPLGKKHDVVIDPARRFGAPILAKSGIPVAIIAGLSQAGESAVAIADWYGIAPASVRDALRFAKHPSSGPEFFH